jgi:hypothetical protein
MTVHEKLTRFSGWHYYVSVRYAIFNGFRNRRRVLRKGSGAFLYLTFGQPHFRKRYLTRPETTLEIQQIGDAFHYYFYILRT